MYDSLHLPLALFHSLFFIILDISRVFFRTSLLAARGEEFFFFYDTVQREHVSACDKGRKEISIGFLSSALLRLCKEDVPGCGALGESCGAEECRKNFVLATNTTPSERTEAIEYYLLRKI